MADDHLAGSLQAVLEDPPLPPDATDDARFTAAVTQAVRRRRRTRTVVTGGLAALAVAAGIITPTVIANSGHQHPPSQSTATARPGNKLTEKVIVNAIMTAARYSKDPTPSSIQYVYGKRNQLSTLVSGDTIGGADGQVPSVLVEAIGNFSVPVVSAPVMEPDSKGAAICLIINEQTGEVTDSGINKNPINLAPAGKVFHPAVPKNFHPAKTPTR